MKPLFFSILFVLLLPAGFAHSQQHVFAASASNSIFGEAHNILTSIDLSNCTSRYIDTLPVGMYTIALTPNGRLWAIANDTVGAELYQVDTSTGNLTYAGHFDTHGDFVQSIGVLNDSVLLIPCNNDLYGVTTSNVHSFRIGTVGNYRFGDITWLGQDLYIIGCNGYPDSMFLVKVTFNNGSYPPIASAAPVNNTLSLPYCYGLATIILPNTDTALIGFADSNAYIIDPADGSYTLFCDILPDSLGHFADAASASYPSVPIILDTVNPNPNSIVSPSGNGLKVKLYPNPATKALNISYESDVKTTLILTDMTGRIMFQKRLVNGTQQVDITPLAAGSYIVIIQAEGMGVCRQKLIKN